MKINREKISQNRVFVNNNREFDCDNATRRPHSIETQRKVCFRESDEG